MPRRKILPVQPFDKSPCTHIQAENRRSGLLGIAVGDPINRVNLLYLIDVDRIHRIDRTRDVGSIDPDPG